MSQFIKNFFQLSKNKTNVRTEILAGVTSFFTMAYIVIIAPTMLANTGINYSDAFLATCLVTAFGSILCGLYANLPIALAPGLALLSYFTYVAVGQLGLTWQSALGAVFISGVIFVFISVTKIRLYLIESIPKSICFAITAGLGLFIGFIALKNVGFIVGSPGTLVSLGNLKSDTVLLFIFGFFIILILENLRVTGALIIGMLIVTVVGILFKVNSLQGIVAWPTGIHDSFYAFDLRHILNLKTLPIIFTFVMVALFDSTGCLIGLMHNVGAESGVTKLKKINRALIADSINSVFSSFLGVTTSSPFIENAAGIRVGGRTGLTAIVVAVLFLLVIFFAPLASSIPVFATSAALFYVACLMMRPIAMLDFQDLTEFVPAIISLVTIPLTFSIVNGVGFGIITYIILKLTSGKVKDLRITTAILGLVFLLYFMVC